MKPLSAQKGAFIAGIVSSKITGSAVYVNANGRLGLLASSERYKTVIAPIRADTTGVTSEATQRRFAYGKRLYLRIDAHKKCRQYIARILTRRKINMHFRERNQIVQIIRTKYDAETKKGKNEIVGRLTKANPKLSDELKAALTPEERKEVATWIAGHASVERLKQELAVRTLQERMTLAEAWFAGQKGDEARFLAASLVPAWTRLRAALKKNGLLE